MPQYKLQRDYYASTMIGGSIVKFGPWMEGDVVDLPEEQAAICNVDSPGVLKKAPKKKAISKKGK